MLKFALRTCCAVGGLWCAVTTATAAEPEVAGPRPVPRMQVLPLPQQQDAFTRDGVEIARYHYGPDQQRPFLYPLIGPSGRSLTRMGHPHDPITHSHHNSVWISHHDLNGVNFWGDTGKGRIVHERVEFYDDTDAAATAQALNTWRDGDKKTLLQERRRMSVQPLANDEWLLVLDLELSPPDQPATFAKSAFGLLGVRMAKTIGVHDGGGTIRNSAGDVNEKEVFWKPARWCDYSGPIAPGKTEGITLFDHPSNPNHPTVFHVRNDGWMGASLTFAGPHTIESGAPLRLRYGLYIHRDAPTLEQIDAQYQQFTKLESPATLVLPKKTK